MVCSVNNDLGRCPAKSVVVVAVRISRDPIAEKGGYNLYAFVNNDPVSKLDYLGREELSPMSMDNPWSILHPQNWPTPSNNNIPDVPVPPSVPGAYGIIYKRPTWHYPKEDEGKPCCGKPAKLVSGPKIININTSFWTVTMDSTIQVEDAKDLTWAWDTCWRGNVAGYFPAAKNSSFSLTASPLHTPIKFRVEYIWLSCEGAENGKMGKWVKKTAAKSGALHARNLWMSWTVNVTK